MQAFRKFITFEFKLSLENARKLLSLVIDDFCKSANIVLTAFQNDGHYVAAKKVLKK